MARTIAKDHDEKRGHILKVAARTFAEQGFDRASVNRLAQECGISKANIYHYYDSKDALLFDVLDTYLRGLRDRLHEVVAMDLPPDARLRRLVTETLRAYDGADSEHQLQINRLHVLPPEQQEILRDYQRDMVRYLSDAIRAQAPDVFDGECAKLRATTMSVFGMLNWFYMWNTDATEAAREEYAGLVSDLTLKGIRGL